MSTAVNRAVNRAATITDADVLAYRNVPVELAALYLGASPMYVRCGLRDKEFPFGTALQMTANRWTYHISAPRLVAYHNGQDMIPGNTEDADGSSAAKEETP